MGILISSRMIPPSLFGLAVLLAGGGTWARLAGEEVIFRQPALAGIGAAFYNPKVVRQPPPLGTFQMILWQPNPLQPDGRTVPVVWDAAVKTGLRVASARDGQTGFADRAGSTVAQAAGGEVGAFLNSDDFAGRQCDKMMVTLQYKFPEATLRDGRRRGQRHA